MNKYSLRNTFMAEIYTLSKRSSKPTQAYEVMIQVAKSNIRLQKAYYRRDLLSQLIDRDTPVNAVAQICKKSMSRII